MTRSWCRGLWAGVGSDPHWIHIPRLAYFVNPEVQGDPEVNVSGASRRTGCEQRNYFATIQPAISVP